MIGTREQLEERLGYQFSRPELLERALTHSSAIPELRVAHVAEGASELLPQDNEQFEFLGDAVLDMLASEYLIALFPEWSEGQLSKSRARLVNARALELAARRLRLGEHFRLGRGEEKTGGRDKPALLADAFEAVIAAVYLDGGLIAAREVLRHSLFQKALEERGERIADSDRKPLRVLVCRLEWVSAIRKLARRITTSIGRQAGPHFRYCQSCRPGRRREAVGLDWPS